MSKILCTAAFNASSLGVTHIRWKYELAYYNAVGGKAILLPSVLHVGYGLFFRFDAWKLVAINCRKSLLSACEKKIEN